tara:strand:+ start:756 stop:1463 length:708 start_codon:yes stop_codon:yes gene_type:complete
MKKSYSVHQPNLIPWIGYFIKWALADQFVYLDDVQLSVGNSVTKRVSAKFKNEDIWLNLRTKKSQFQKKINETYLKEDIKWRDDLKNNLLRSYSNYKYFEEIYYPLIDIIDNQEIIFVSDFNIKINDLISNNLKLKSALKSSSMKIKTTSTERIRDIGKYIKGDIYISGFGGQNYQKEEIYNDANIDLKYFISQKEIKFIDDISVTIFEHISKLGFKKVSEIIYNYKENWHNQNV